MGNPTPASATATRKLADTLVAAAPAVDAADLAEYVTVRRAAGRSWRLIARDLLDDVGIDVHPETLRSWFPALHGERAAS